MRKLTFSLIFLMVAALFVAPVIAQDVGSEALPDFIQHTACEQDLSGQTVTLYHFGDLSGPYAFITQPLLAGVSDAIAYYNAHGGVCGAAMVQEYTDTGGRPEDTQAAYDRYSTLDPKPDIFLLYASGDSELLRSQMTEDQIPAFISAGSVPGLYGEDAATPGWIYATNPLYTDQLGSFCQFVAANTDRFPEPVVGYISWPGAFGEAAFTPETIGYCESLGVDIVDTPEYFPPSATDISTNVQNLVDAGANILYSNSLASGPVLIAKTVVDLGLEDSVQLSGVNWVLDTSVGLLGRTSLGADGLPAVNGLIGSIPFRWWTETTIPGIALVNEIATANERRPQDKNIAYLLGWGAVDTYIEMYAQAVNEVGSLDAVDGSVIQGIIDNMVYSPLGLYDVDYQGGAIRALPNNRIAQMAFLNATGDGPATSGDDAFTVQLEDGTTAFIPIIIPLTEFAPAPDLKPGGADVPAS
jgi:branched-chain amino acid transport system substrate-binding protein